MTPTQTDGNGAVAAPEEQQQQPSFARQMLTSMLQMLLISFVTRYALSYFMNTSSRSNGPSPVERGGAQSAVGNFYRDGDYYSLWVFSEERSWDDELVSSPSLIWKLDGLIFGDYSSGLFGNATYYHTTTFDASKSLSQNGRLYLTSCFLSATHDESPDLSKGYHWKGQSCYKKEITHHRKYKPANRRKLLEGIKGVGGVTVETPLHDEMAERYNDTELTHWNSRLSINAVYGLPSFKGGEVPDPMNKFVYVDPDSRMTYPVVYHNDFWNYHSEYTPVTHLNRTLTLNLMFYPISFFKWQFYLAQNEQHQWSFMQKNSPNELDSMKRLFLETNFYVLTLTISVSILHTVFEMLAFKHDIQFWRERTTHEGLSLRSVLFGIVQHVIVLLYVLDNETNVMVTLGLGLGLLIELWKITKIFHIGVKRFSPSFPVPVPTLTYRSSAYLESKTHEYDTIAFKYLSVALFPLVISYAAYSLMYHEHKGWYSFVLGVLYGCLLTFGFIMMTPQLFINYKLKSVAHLPWKMLTYKALNTFIDDIFAFVITMPTLYRLGCLRDDMIFLVYLYQRWIYPTDMTRVNEFGVSGQVENSEKQ